MKHLILIRHGQSEWNQQKRFTGWVDVGLTDKGRAEAKKAGELIKEKKIKLDSFYSSYQKRANDTLKIVMKELNEDENLITKKWQLNGTQIKIHPLKHLINFLLLPKTPLCKLGSMGHVSENMKLHYFLQCH